ncbi:helix-turn-helix domain-containing protein [Paenibacillus caui]|uniref:helix-turn-helix domain-containing protein n=1 Tax=Paenibacillus caui TaxID=2873927 RepID=UPI001CA874BE|nr:helix-turn-helix domain-containing protein [Paenibacillus caui]
MNAKFNYSREAANVYLPKIAQESTFTDHHKGFTIVPHKFLRCYGLSEYEKLILIDLWSYMGDNHHCYPSIETIARNVSCSSKTVERHMDALAKKGLVLVSNSQRNNTYYLPNDMHKNPYLLLSEKTHEFIREVRNTVNDYKLSQWIKGVVKSEVYHEFIIKLTYTMKHEFRFDKGETELNRVQAIP